MIRKYGSSHEHLELSNTKKRRLRHFVHTFTKARYIKKPASESLAFQTSKVVYIKMEILCIMMLDRDRITRTKTKKGKKNIIFLPSKGLMGVALRLFSPY